MNRWDWLGLSMLAVVMGVAGHFIMPAAPAEITDFEIDDVPGQFARITYEHGRVISFKPQRVNGMEFRPNYVDTGEPAVLVFYQGGSHRLDVSGQKQGFEVIEFIERHKTNQ